MDKCYIDMHARLPIKGVNTTYNQTQTQVNIGIITFPMSVAGIVPLSKLSEILCSLSNNTYLITGNATYSFFQDKTRLYTYGINHITGKNIFSRVFNYILTQLRISNLVRKLSRNVDVWVFHVGGETLIFPMIMAKLFRKKTILILTGYIYKSSEARKEIFLNPIKILSKVNRHLTDHILLYSQAFIKKWSLRKHHHKISIARHQFINFKQFNIQIPIDERDNLVGYIGRLSEEKGILNFIKSISKILDIKDDVKFLLGGDGHLRNEIKEYLNKENLNGKVKFLGWIPHDELQKYLNELKLIIVPSYSESVPIIMLEAMACGTPVLITQVGLASDIIIEGTTGFLLKSNDPKHIAERTIEILNKPEILEKASMN